jgi:transcription elongation factor GreA
MATIPLTRRGADLLKEELHRLKSVERHAVIQAIAEARAQGDLSENAEYEAAKDKQGFIEGRIKELEGKLAAAQVIDPASAGRRRQGGLRRHGRPGGRGQRPEGHLPDRRRRRGRPEAGPDLHQQPDRARADRQAAGDVAEVQAPGGLRTGRSSTCATAEVDRCSPPARLLPGLWLGVLLCVAGLATPAPFALLERPMPAAWWAHAGARGLHQPGCWAWCCWCWSGGPARAAAEAGQGSQFSAGMMLALGAVFCTVAGYFGCSR